MGVSRGDFTSEHGLQGRCLARKVHGRSLLASCTLMLWGGRSRGRGRLKRIARVDIGRGHEHTLHSGRVHDGAGWSLMTTGQATEHWPCRSLQDLHQRCRDVDVAVSIQTATELFIDVFLIIHR